MFRKYICFIVALMMVMAYTNDIMACVDENGYDDGCGYYYDYSYDECGTVDYTEDYTINSAEEYVFDDDCDYYDSSCEDYDDGCYDGITVNCYDYDVYNDYNVDYDITTISDSFNTYYMGSVYNITYNNYYGDVVYATNYNVSYTYNEYNQYNYGNVVCDANLRDCYGDVIGYICAGSSVEVLGPCTWDYSRVEIYDYCTGCTGSVMASAISNCGGYSCGGYDGEYSGCGEYQQDATTNTCSLEQYVDCYDYTGVYGSADTWACDNRAWADDNCGGTYSSSCEYAWANTPEATCY